LLWLRGQLKKYNIIYADPAWAYPESGTGTRTVAAHYPCLDINVLKRLDIDSLAADNCALFLWVTFPRLREGLELILAWRFIYKTIAFCWIKTNKSQNLKQFSFLPTQPNIFWGMGSYTRSNPEICLLGLKGKMKPLRHDIHSVVIDKIRRHSEKPPIIREKIIKLFGDIPRIELFARQKVNGWDVWGNEVESDIELTHLHNKQNEADFKPAANILLN
jgi:N6-adenosine-specific RNA methylase IME4